MLQIYSIILMHLFKSPKDKLTMAKLRMSETEEIKELRRTVEELTAINMWLEAKVDLHKAKREAAEKELHELKLNNLPRK